MRSSFTVRFSYIPCKQVWENLSTSYLFMFMELFKAISPTYIIDECYEDMVN